MIFLHAFPFQIKLVLFFLLKLMLFDSHDSSKVVLNLQLCYFKLFISVCFFAYTNQASIYISRAKIKFMFYYVFRFKYRFYNGGKRFIYEKFLNLLCRKRKRIAPTSWMNFLDQELSVKYSRKFYQTKPSPYVR